MTDSIKIKTGGANDLLGYLDSDTTPNLFYQSMAPVINESAYAFGSPYKEFTSPNYYDIIYLGPVANLIPLADNSPLLLDTKGRHYVTACVLMPVDFCTAAFESNAGVFALGAAGYSWDASISKWQPESFNMAVSDDGTSAYELRYTASDASTKYIKTVINGVAYYPMPISWIPTLGFDKMQILLMDSQIANSGMAATYTGKILLYCKAY